MNLAEEIVTTKVNGDEIAVFWLGQAGFVIKDSAGRVVVIDPYLTDCVEREIGFKRMTPKLIAPHELEADMLIASHDHLDHFDIDAVPGLMANGKTRLLGSVTAAGMAIEIGIVPNRVVAMKPGDIVEIVGLSVKAVYADHGESAPDALGIVLTMGGYKIYYAADTAYHPEVVRTAKREKPDIIMVPINGQYGNLNGEEAARLAGDSAAKIAIPCHFWTFTAHRGDPQEFMDALQKYAPDCEGRLFHQGEKVVFSRV